MSPKLQPVRGTHDWIGEDYDHFSYLAQKIEEIARRYNYSGLITPIFEHANVFTKNLGEESDIVGKEMYTFEDRGGDLITLRPEGTAPLVRAIISNGMTQNLPLKAFYHGPMFRYERPQGGRTRQFHQFGIECLGIDHPLCDVEVIHMANSVFRELNIDKKITIEINTLGHSEDRERYKKVLVDYLAIYESDLSEDSKRRLTTNPLRILDSKDVMDKEITESAPKLHDVLDRDSLLYFEKVCEGLERLAVPFVVNQRLVRGLDYYSHTAFEFTTTLLGAQGAVGAGGRYNGLVEQMGGSQLAGVGWALGIERLLALSDITLPSKPLIAIIPLDSSCDEEAFFLAQKLRECSSHHIEVALSGNASKRMKRADKLGATHAILLDKSEMAHNMYVMRNMLTKEQKLIPHSQIVRALIELN